MTAPAHRVRRLEPAALAGVMSRDVVLFGRYWKATTFSSIVQPTIYLLAFGLGFGSLVSHVQHVRYVEYVGTGVVATAVLFSSAFPGMFNTFIRWKFQRTYDAMLAAPVDVEELITAEVLWISVRAGVYRPAVSVTAASESSCTKVVLSTTMPTSLALNRRYGWTLAVPKSGDIVCALV